MRGEGRGEGGGRRRGLEWRHFLADVLADGLPYAQEAMCDDGRNIEIKWLSLLAFTQYYGASTIL